jgi:Rieske 2Fe-2S family protein
LCLGRQGNLGRSLRCTYHRWTYGLDDRFVSAPYTDAARDLLPVATQEWLGYAWMNLAPDPAPLTEQMEPQLRRRFGEADMLTQYGMEELT